MAAYSWDPSSCITETKSPSSRPTTVSPTSSPNEFQQSGFALPYIPIGLINAPDIDLSNVQSSKVKDAIRSIAEDEVRILNVMIVSVDIIDASYSGRSLSIDQERELESVLTLLIEIRVSETAILPNELYSTILGALALRKYDIDEVLRETVGIEMYKDVVLEIDGHRTTLAPSTTPGSTLPGTSTPGSTTDSVSKIRGEQGTNSNTLRVAERSKVAVVLVVLFGLFFSAIAGGLIAWQRKKESSSDKGFQTRSDHYHRKRQLPRRRCKNKSKGSMNDVLKITNSADADDEQAQIDKTLTLRYTPQEQQQVCAGEFEQGHDREVQIDNTLMLGHTPKEEQLVNTEEWELEQGYDGGKSSFFESQGNMSSSTASGLGERIDPEESEDNVLGLLYYAGASSAEEEEGDRSESIKSARIRRRASNASRQTRRSRRSSISSSSKSKSSRRSSRSHRSRKKQNATCSMSRVDENEYCDYYREENFKQSDEPSIGDVQFPTSGGSVSVSTVSDDGFRVLNRQKSAETAFTEDAASLNVDELFL